jgi:hypothetical protein
MNHWAVHQKEGCGYMQAAANLVQRVILFAFDDDCILLRVSTHCMIKTEPTFLASLRDVVVIGSVLAVVNWLFARADFGWFSLNPTPWLLLPILIGARYGLTTGLVSGLATVGFVVLVRAQVVEDRPLRVVAGDHLYELCSLVLLGFLAGQWRQLQRNRHTELEKENSGLNDSLDGARAEIELLRQSQQDARRQLALHNVVLANLDEDMHDLLTAPAGGFVSGLLDVIHQHAGVTSMALYQQEGEALVRLAALHPTPPLAERLELSQTPLADRALDERTMATIRDPLTATVEQPFLAAFPWTDGTAGGVLLIQDMPLEAMRWENLARVELILHWAFALARWGRKVGAGGQRQALVPLEDFMLLVGQTLQVEQTHRVPSVVLRADLLEQSVAQAPQLPAELLALLPKSAVASRMNHSLYVLIPFGGHAEGETLSKAFQASGVMVRCCHYVTAGTADVRVFWERLMES